MKFFKKKIVIYIIAFIICGVLAYLLYNFLNKNNNDKNNKDLNDNYSVATTISEEPFEDKLLGVYIDDVLYVIVLEDNQGAKDLLYLSPFSIIMDDDNNSKHTYLPISLSMDSNYIDKAYKGDIIVSDYNHIALYYNDSNLEGNYIKIGHIDELGELNSSSVTVSFVR